MKRKPTLLVVDDQETIRDSLCQWLSALGYTVLTAASAQEALRVVRRRKINVLLADLVLPSMDGIELMKRVRELSPTVATVIITGYGSIQTAISAIREGAYDYVEKPFCPEKVELLIRNVLEHQKLLEENLTLRKQIRERRRWNDLVVRSSSMRKILELIQAVAPTNATVLIQGESGTGKEVIARKIHRLSKRRRKPFLATNCASLPESLLESELFGYEKGAFTGAVTQRKGKFEAAQGGTVFLDEIGEMSLNTQVLLLRVLEEKKITRLGGNEEIEVNVRFIAATNRDLKRMVREGTFREDLYWRLNVVTVQLPPLRERPDDILPLAELFLKRYAEELNKPAKRFSPEVVRFMLAYSWPGNVRELQNVVERAVIVSQGPAVTLEHIPPEVYQASEPEPKNLKQVVKNHILRVLREQGGNISKAAQVLGIHRMTLYNKLKEYRSGAEKVDTAG